MVGIIQRGTNNKTVWHYVKPWPTPLQYRAWFWPPGVQKNIVTLGKMRKRSTKMTKAVEHPSLHEKYKNVGTQLGGSGGYSQDL